MSKGCRDGFCFGGYARSVGREGEIVDLGWLVEGERREYALRLYFHLRKTGRVSIKIHILHQIIFVTLTRIEVVTKKPYLLQNPSSEIPETFWVKGHIQIKT